MNLLDEGKRKIIIYPFGDNGQRIKDIMETCYGIAPFKIVDNTYSKYNREILNETELENIFDGSMTIILCIENKEKNNQIYSSLIRFIPKDQIINMNSLTKKSAGGENIYNVLSLENILPNQRKINDYKNATKVSNRKIKIRILNSGYGAWNNTWNAVETICRAFEDDDRFETIVILAYPTSRRIENGESQMVLYKHNYIFEKDYDVRKDLPDILIISHPRVRQTEEMKVWRRYTKMVVAASMTLIRYDSFTADEFFEFIRPGFEAFHPDYYLFDSLLYMELKNSTKFKGKIVEMGNAKFDGIYEACKEKIYPKTWEKLKNKRTILWTTDHGLTSNGVSKYITFDLYASAIFKYAEENKETGIIFRPHGTFISELLEEGIWKQSDLEALKEYCNNSPNIIFDDLDTYDYSYSVADAILTDALCGITCSALPTLKPIGVLYRNDMDIETFHPELMDSYYSIYSEEKLFEFFNMIRLNQDPMLQMRKIASEKYIKHFDGKNGMRIKDFISNKFFEKYI